MTKPNGRYRCLACSKEWDGDELQYSKDNQAVCPTCSGRMRKVEQATGASGQWNYKQLGFSSKRPKRRG